MMILWHNSNDVSVSGELSISDASIEFELWRSSVSTMQAEWRHWYQLVENLQVSVMQVVNLNIGIKHSKLSKDLLEYGKVYDEKTL